jgi:hypothetical protein
MGSSRFGKRTQTLDAMVIPGRVPKRMLKRETWSPLHGRHVTVVFKFDLLTKELAKAP